MPCPFAALQLPLYLLPFLLLIPLSSALSHHPHSNSPKVLFLDPPMPLPAPHHARVTRQLTKGSPDLIAGDSGSSDGIWEVDFEPSVVEQLEEDKEVTIVMRAKLKQGIASSSQIRLLVYDNDWVASISPDLIMLDPGKISWMANITIRGIFVGFAKVKALLEPKEESGHILTSSSVLKVSVIRKNSWMDHAFTISIAVLVSVLFVNFGAALDWMVLRETLRRPIGPAIGFVTQFLFMPIVSYVLGMVLFDSPSMRLGLFFTGCSPGGGASNIWTFALGGNLPLSITMTAISTFASFGMMPFWIFTLGAKIFSSAELSVPYSKIATFAIALVVPLAIGFLLQKKWPKAANFLVHHILKPLCGFLLFFIVVFAIATNLYIFHLFSWKIILCGMGLPWLGFLCGAIAARLFSLTSADILAIAIETGVQNTGIAIFMLRFTLGQPLADLTTVVPVSIAVMTPIPLALFWLYKLFTGQIKLHNKCSDDKNSQRPLRESTMETINGTMTPLDPMV